MRTLFVVSTLAACEPSSPIARLADLPSPRIAGTQNGFNLHYDEGVDCFELSADVTALVDGKPVTVTRGGARSTPHGDVCDGMSFGPSGPLDDRPLTSIELSDPETTCTFDVEGLAPQRWTITAPATVTEGGDVTASYAPVVAGVALEFVYIDRAAIGMITAKTADSMTVHIPEGHWSQPNPALHGTMKAGTLGVKLAPLPVRGCDVTACNFSIDAPQPHLPITIVIP
jgi:hypothetical protein